MKRKLLAGFVLLLLIAVTSLSPALASEEPAVDDSAPRTLDDPIVSDSGENSSGEPEPTTEPEPEPTTEPEPEPTTEPEPKPTTEPEPEPTAEPTSASKPVHKPTLQVLGSSTISVNQETPAIQIIWDGGIPENVSGYVWSYGLSGGSLSMFNISYDSQRAELAAGALNGHIHEAGTYIIECQPVDADQDPATPSAQTRLQVESSSRELIITAETDLPVPVGSSLELVPDAGDFSADVVRYEWKPSGSNSESKVCKISSVVAGTSRYTCTAVLSNGERVTGTFLVTGTGLTSSPSSVSLADGKTDTLRANWSHGTPLGTLTYQWSVQGESGVNLQGYTDSELPIGVLAYLSPRTNPYVVTCQAYSNDKPVGKPTSFKVRANGNPARAFAAANPSASASQYVASDGSKVVSGVVVEHAAKANPAPEPSSPAPSTADSSISLGWYGLAGMLAICAICACMWRLRKRATH